MHPVSGSRLCDNKGSAMGNVQIVLAHAKIKGEYVLHIYLTQMFRLSFDFMWYEFMCLSKLDFFEYVTGHKLHLNNAFSITKLQSPLETLKVCVSKCAFIFLALAIVLKHIWHWEELDLFVFSWHFHVQSMRFSY